jgi:hypothetical protein
MPESWLICLVTLGCSATTSSQTRIKMILDNASYLQLIRCLNKHLKDVTLEEYCGSEREVEFARFIVGGAKALTALQIVVHAANWSDKSINSHNDLICRGGKASSEAQVNFRKSKKGKNKLRNSYSTVQRVPIV